MQMLHLRVIFFGLLLASAFPAGSASALQSDVAATAQPAPFTTIFLTSSHGAKNPATSSRYVVWQDKRNGNWDIYAYDLVENVEFQVTRESHDQFFPSISGDIVVWEDLRDDAGNIYGYDLARKREFLVHAGRGGDMRPKIFGEYVVWLRQQICITERCGTIPGLPMAKNLTTGLTWEIPSDRKLDRLELSGRFAWWLHYDEWYLYDLVSRSFLALPGPLQVAGDGLVSVWFTGEDGYGIHAYNPITGDSVYLGDMGETGARVRGRMPLKDETFSPDNLLHVWADYRWGQYDIYSYDFADQKERQLTFTADVLEERAAVHGNIIAWEERAQSCGDQYCQTEIRVARLDLLDQRTGPTPSESDLGARISTLASGIDFDVTNAYGVLFADEFQRLGAVDTLGYPASFRFQGEDGFIYQLTQGALLQWRPEVGGAYLANTFEILEQAGLDDWLFHARGVPRPIQDDGSGGDWNKAREARLSWLTNEQIRAKYLANPNPARIASWSVDRAIELYGLPMSRPERHGPFISQRFQRITLQLWVDDVEGMPAPGMVVRVLGGDLLKDAGLLPPQAFVPSEFLVPRSTPTP